MNRSTVLAIPFVLTFLLVPSFNPITAAEHRKGPEHNKGPHAAFTVVNAEQVKQLMSGKNKVFILDARSRPEYKYGHIPGAINIPSPAVRAFPKRLPKNKSTLIILYDRGDNLIAVDRATKDVIKMGYTNVKCFLGGILEWLDKHYPVKKGVRP